MGALLKCRVAQMDHYSQSLDEDKMARVKADMDDVKNVMVDNIEKARASSLLRRACAERCVSIAQCSLRSTPKRVEEVES
jgi:hypothetical protein